MNLASMLTESARRDPAAPALRQAGVTRDYGELAGRVARLAGALDRLGLSPGDRVGIVMWNRPEVIELLFACFHGGFCAVPVNARSVPAEVADLLADAAPAAVAYAPEYQPHVDALAATGLRFTAIALDGDGDGGYEGLIAAADPAPAVDLPPDAPAWLFYSSGTTGRMKGATLTHRNLRYMVHSFLADLYSLGPDDVALHAAPLTHGSGLYALAPVARGCLQVLTDSRSYDPEEVLSTVERDRVSFIAFLAPTMLQRLTAVQRERGADVSSLRCVIYGGAPMHARDLGEALLTFGPVLAQIYGQAEAPVTIARLGMTAHQALIESGDEERLLSTGPPYTGTELRIVSEEGAELPPGQVGEVLVHNDAVMSGYWNSPDQTAATIVDGWLRTGDLGYRDDRGWLYLVDRSKDVIISGGANVYPREVEEAVLKHPDVREVAVVGAPDREWGERVVCAIVSGRDGSDGLEAELVAHCRERLSGYKVPRQWLHLEEMPKSAYGKVLKREIRDELWRDEERKI